MKLRGKRWKWIPKRRVELNVKEVELAEMS